MSFSFTEMWQHMGVPAKIVGAFLLAMGLASLTVFIERLLALRRSRAAARKFAADFGEILHEGNLDAVIAEAAKYPQAHLPRLVHAAPRRMRSRAAAAIPPSDRWNARAGRSSAGSRSSARTCAAG
jgi:hypothetical protein